MWRTCDSIRGSKSVVQKELRISLHFSVVHYGSLSNCPGDGQGGAPRHLSLPGRNASSLPPAGPLRIQKPSCRSSIHWIRPPSLPIRNRNPLDPRQKHSFRRRNPVDLNLESTGFRSRSQCFWAGTSGFQSRNERISGGIHWVRERNPVDSEIELDHSRPETTALRSEQNVPARHTIAR